MNKIEEIVDELNQGIAEAVQEGVIGFEEVKSITQEL